MSATQNLVLAGIDGSALTGAVCDYAAWIAQKVDAPLKLLHTIDHHPEHADHTDITGNIGVDSRDHLMDELTQLEQQRSKL
ncbi:MAG: universal stress protein, partial [Candidatus Buchananbacteria bacterium]